MNSTQHSSEEAEIVAAVFVSGFDIERIDLEPELRRRLERLLTELQQKEFAEAWKESIARLS